MNLEAFKDHFEGLTTEYFEFLEEHPTIYYMYDKGIGWACFSIDTTGEKRMDVPLKDTLSNPFNKNFYNLGNKKLDFELGAYIQQIFKLNKAELTSPNENLIIVKQKKDYSENMEIEDFLMSLMTFPKQTVDLNKNQLAQLEEYFFLTSNYIYEFEEERTLFRELKELWTTYDNRFIINITYEIPLGSTIVQNMKNAFMIRNY